MSRVYIAGPFFNDRQVQLVMQIEQILEHNKISYYSPRKIPLNTIADQPKLNDAEAKKIFRKDVVEIDLCQCVIAIVDYLLGSPNASLGIVTLEGEAPEVVASGIRIPDSGTVWEMGYAFAQDVPVYLYTDDPKRKMNLMLTQSCEGVIKGMAMLGDFLRGGKLNLNVLGEWEGDHR